MADPAGAEPEPSGSHRKQLMETEVLEHATRLFAERGFAGTRLRDVAQAMGLQRPAIYYYFNSKEALLDRLIRDVTVGPVHDLGEIGARTELDPAARLHEMAQWIVRWIVAHTDRFLLLLKSESDLSPAAAEKFDDGRRAAFRAVRAVIEEGIEAEQFRPVDARVATFGVWGICNWVALWYEPERSTRSMDSITIQLADMAVAGLLRAEYRDDIILSLPRAFATIRDNLEQLEQALDGLPSNCDVRVESLTQEMNES